VTELFKTSVAFVGAYNDKIFVTVFLIVVSHLESRKSEAFEAVQPKYMRQIDTPLGKVRRVKSAPIPRNPGNTYMVNRWNKSCLA
jgi:hypothetical protein